MSAPYAYLDALFEQGIIARLNLSETRVLLAIAMHVGSQEDDPQRYMRSWPGVRRLSELTGLVASTIYKALDRLKEEHGLVDWTEKEIVPGPYRAYEARVYTLTDPSTLAGRRLSFTTIVAGERIHTRRAATPQSPVGDTIVSGQTTVTGNRTGHSTGHSLTGNVTAHPQSQDENFQSGFPRPQTAAGEKQLDSTSNPARERAQGNGQSPRSFEERLQRASVYHELWQAAGRRDDSFFVGYVRGLSQELGIGEDLARSILLDFRSDNVSARMRRWLMLGSERSQVEG